MSGIRKMQACTAGVMAAAVWLASASSAGAGGGVLFVAPARHSVLQVLQDVLQRHSGHVLVSYQTGAAPDALLLHAWNGRDWVPVPMTDYRQGHFLRALPRRALLLGPEDMLPEQLIVATDRFVPVVLNVPELDSASILNAVGRLLDFRPAEWRRFARRYDLDLSDANEPLREHTWYDQPHEPRRFEFPPHPVPPRRRRPAAPPPTTPVPPAPAADPVPPAPEPAIQELPPRVPEPEEPVLPRPEPAPPGPASPEQGIK